MSKFFDDTMQGLLEAVAIDQKADSSSGSKWFASHYFPCRGNRK